MATFTLSKGTAKGKTWKATGTNPLTGKPMTIQGGQAGVKTGKDNRDSQKVFDARHDATGMTPKKFINKLLWNDKKPSLNGGKVTIPNKLFKK